MNCTLHFTHATESIWVLRLIESLWNRSPPPVVRGSCYQSSCALSAPQRSIELQPSEFAHTLEVMGTGLQTSPTIPVVLTVRTTCGYAAPVTREGQDRRNAQFVPFVLEQELSTAPVRITEPVARLRSVGISGRGLEPTLAIATYEQYPAARDSDELHHITGRSVRSSGSTDFAIDWMRRGFASPDFLSFDIEQPMPEEQNMAPIASQPAATFRNRPVREGGNHLDLSAAAGTWSEPFELLPLDPLTLESSLLSGATNRTLPHSLLKPLDGVAEFRHLNVAAATSTWCEPTPWEVAKTRAHEPLLSLRGPSCKSLVPSVASQTRSDSLFPPAPFVYEDRGGSRLDQGLDAAAPSITSDPASTWDLEALNTVLSNAGADFDPAASDEDSEVDTETRRVPGLFAGALQERFFPMSFTLQRSHPQWLNCSVIRTPDPAPNPDQWTLHDAPYDSNFSRRELEQSGVRAFGPFRMETNAQPGLQWSPCRTSTRRNNGTLGQRFYRSYSYLSRKVKHNNPIS